MGWKWAIAGFLGLGLAFKADLDSQIATLEGTYPPLRPVRDAVLSTATSQGGTPAQIATLSAWLDDLSPSGSDREYEGTLPAGQSPTVKGWMDFVINSSHWNNKSAPSGGFSDQAYL